MKLNSGLIGWPLIQSIDYSFALIYSCCEKVLEQLIHTACCICHGLNGTFTDFLGYSEHLFRENVWPVRNCAGSDGLRLYSLFREKREERERQRKGNSYWMSFLCETLLLAKLRGEVQLYQDKLIFQLCFVKINSIFFNWCLVGFPADNNWIVWEFFVNWNIASKSKLF